MEYNISRKAVAVNEVIYEGSLEQAVDCDIVLPDYCADISRILKCFITPNISSASLSGDKVMIDGTAQVRLLYVGEDATEICCHEQTSAFSKQVDVKGNTFGAAISITTCVQYVNCRAVSQRRVDVHGAFAINLNVIACSDEEVVAGAEGAGIQLRSGMVTACNAIGNAQMNVNVTQVTDLGQSNPAVKNIIRNTAVPVLQDIKQITNKILVKGELIVKTLYCSENGTIEHAENALPISQIIDIEGVDEDSICDVRLSLMSIDVIAKPNATGSISLLDIAGIVSVRVCAYGCMELPVITDTYSTDYDLEYDSKSIRIDSLIDNISDTYISRSEIDCGSGGISKVIDLWCAECSAKAKSEEGNLKVEGEMSVFALVLNEEQQIQLVESKAEYSYAKELQRQAAEIKCEPSVEPVGVDYSITENTIDARIQLKVSAAVFETGREKIVSEINIDEESKKKTTRSALTIYFCEPGEDVWDIARKYNTTSQKIMSQNKIEASVISEKRMLLIPSM